MTKPIFVFKFIWTILMEFELKVLKLTNCFASHNPPYDIIVPYEDIPWKLYRKWLSKSKPAIFDQTKTNAKNKGAFSAFQHIKKWFYQNFSLKYDISVITSNFVSLELTLTNGAKSRIHSEWSDMVGNTVAQNSLEYIHFNKMNDVAT